MNPCARNVPVLMYHHVTRDGGSLAVGVEQFDHQMRGLAEAGWRTLGAEEFAAFLRGAPVPPKSLLLTFDDGYLDNWVYAHPVLQRYGLSAMLFIVTGLIGNGRVRPVHGQGPAVPDCPAHQQAKQQMFGENPDKVMLRWDEVHAMRAAGTFEFHSHTHTHVRWDRHCADAREKNRRIHDDIAQSRRILAERLGEASSHLCWPQGYFDNDYLRMAHELGFQHFYTTDARGQNVAGGDPAHIYRMAARNRGYAWLRQRLWLAGHPVWGPLYNQWKARSDARKRAAMQEVSS